MHVGAMAPTDSKFIQSVPDFALEQNLIDAGARFVAGVDEVGRGPLAGPVVVSAVILDPNNIPDGLNDSKKLTHKKREAVFIDIIATAHVSVISAPPSIIDQLNIRGATLWAMTRAVATLGQAPCHALIDGRDIPPGLICPADYVIKGDGRSLSIAAASIVAKVVRDRMCPIMDADGGDYAFARHKGYGTAIHLEALNQQGPSPHHRMGFAPVAHAARRRC